MSSLISLKTLNLENNLIYDLSNSIVSSLNNLNQLILNHNKLESFTSFSSLLHIDLSYNSLDRLSIGRSNGVNVLILKSTRLNINFSNFSNLTYLDVSFSMLNGSLETLNSTILTHLDMSNSLLVNVTSAHINSLTNLNFLNMSNLTCPDFVSTLNLSLLVKLEQLDISYNNLGMLRGDFFENLTSLKLLNLKETNLVDFEFLESFEFLGTFFNEIYLYHFEENI